MNVLPWTELGSFENPIKCNGVEGEYTYLNKLVGPRGVPIEYQRKGSVSNADGVILDVYEISYEGLEYPIIAYFNMYANRPFDKAPIAGLLLETDFFKTQPWQKLGYLNSILQKEFKGIKPPPLPEKFVYMYSKAAILLSYGPYIYSKRDKFNMPKLNWDLTDLMSCAEQLVHHAKGIIKEHPIVTFSTETGVHFLKTFHLDSDCEISTDDALPDLFCITAFHAFTKEKIILYFKCKSF